MKAVGNQMVQIKMWGRPPTPFGYCPSTMFLHV